MTNRLLRNDHFIVISAAALLSILPALTSPESTDLSLDLFFQSSIGAIPRCRTYILYDFYIFVLVLYQLEMMKLNKHPFKILCPLEIKAPYTLKYFWMSELTKILINVCGVGRTQTKSLLKLRTRECSISVKCYVHKIL